MYVCRCWEALQPSCAARSGALLSLSSVPWQAPVICLQQSGADKLLLCPQVYNGMLDAARGVISRQGFRGLYSGLSVTLVEIIPYAALQFGLYDLFTAAAAGSHSTEVLGPSNPPIPSFLDSSLCDLTGAHGKPSSITLLGSTPMPMQTLACQADRRNLVMRELLRRAGHYFWSSPSAHVQPGKAQQRWERFFCGLAAGMMAKLGTHPLDVAKKRFQVISKQADQRPVYVKRQTY